MGVKVEQAVQVTLFNYNARRLIGSRIIESAAYCNQKLLAHLYLNSTQNTSLNWIIRLLLSLLCWLKVILLSGGHCISIYLKESASLEIKFCVDQVEGPWHYSNVTVTTYSPISEVTNIEGQQYFEFYQKDVIQKETKSFLEKIRN
jgi:hypothetical protein